MGKADAKKDIPKITVEVKSADSLIQGLTDVHQHPLPRTGIVIKRVTHCSPVKTEYIVPENGRTTTPTSRKSRER